MLRGGADSPALPLELWGRVASFLALRESCMLASTCRALWAMELLSLDFQGGKTPPGEVAWAAKRWSRARLLKVSNLRGDAKELSQALASCKADDLAYLEELHLHDNSNPACAAAYSQLLTKARNVQVLYANVACLNLVGCARGIKHLALQIQNPHCGHLSSAICGLQQLETLWLADFEGPQSEPQTSGALQLYTLQCLRSLALTNVVPEGISCSENCELHVDLELDFRSMEHPVWDTVLPHVRSVALFGLSPALEALPSILCKAGKLMKADVVVDYCGMAHAPLLLDGSLAHVEELVMCCRELHAIVPAHVTWRNIYVAATHLNLRFEAVAPFGEAIPAFCFRFKELKGTALFHLAAVVAKRLPEWAGTLDDAFASSDERLISGMCFPLAQLPDIGEDEKMCCCGACSDCLYEAGILH